MAAMRLPQSREGRSRGSGGLKVRTIDASSRERASASMFDVASISAEDHAWGLLLSISGANAKLGFGSSDDAVLRAAQVELGALALEGQRMLSSWPVPQVSGAGPSASSRLEAVASKKATNETVQDEAEAWNTRALKKAQVKEEQVRAMARRQAKEEEIALEKEKAREEKAREEAQKQETLAVRKQEEEQTRRKIDEELLLMRARYEARKKEQDVHRKDSKEASGLRAAKQDLRERDSAVAQKKVAAEGAPANEAPKEDRNSMKKDKEMQPRKDHTPTSSKESDSAGVHNVFQRLMAFVSGGSGDAETGSSQASTHSKDCWQVASEAGPPAESQTLPKTIVTEVAEPSSGNNQAADGEERSSGNIGRIADHMKPACATASATEEATVSPTDEAVATNPCSQSRSRSRSLNKRARDERRKLQSRTQGSVSATLTPDTLTVESAAGEHRDDAHGFEDMLEVRTMVSGARCIASVERKKLPESLAAKRKKNLQTRAHSLSSTTAAEAADGADCDEATESNVSSVAVPEISVLPGNTQADESESEPELPRIVPWEGLMHEAVSQDEADWVVFELLRNMANAQYKRKKKS